MIKLPMAGGGGSGPPKPVAHEEKESNNTTQTTSNQAPAADTGMIDILKVISYNFVF